VHEYIQKIIQDSKLSPAQLLHEVWTNLRLLDSVNGTNYAKQISKELEKWRVDR